MTNVNDAAREAAESFRRKQGKGEQPSGDSHMFILMDESGSMMGLEEAVIGGCNQFMHEAADVAGARVWLAMFDATPEEPRTRFKVRRKRVAKMRPLVPGDYRPRGMTPLNDAIVDSVVALDKATEKDDTVFLAIITDGLENASETSTDEVRRLLEKREAAGWGIVFLGANQDTIRTAAEFGMHRPGRAFNFDAEPASVRRSMTEVSRMAHYRSKMGPGVRGRNLYDEMVEGRYAETGGHFGGEEEGDGDSESDAGKSPSPRRDRRAPGKSPRSPRRP